MSYRCDGCNAVCDHQQIRIVTETRTMPNHTQQIVREEALCETCAKSHDADVTVNPAKNGALYQRPFDDPELVRGSV